MLFLLLVASGAASAPAGVISPGYTQNFTALGPTGTNVAVLPEWSVYRYADGNSGTWTNTTGIAAAAVGGGTLMDAVTGTESLGLFYKSTSPTFTRLGGINAGLSLNPNDPNRALGSSPTGFKGNALQLALDNNTGGSLTQLNISYDTIVLAPPTNATDDQLLGYRLFYSLTGVAGTWLAAPALDTVTGLTAPAFTTYTTSATLTLDTPLGDSESILFRWVDDNAFLSSPDQMIAIDNISVSPFSAVPEPGTALFGLALVGMMASRRRRTA